ncbi:MAG: prolyl oligopeptidase family serine peptidase [Ignavibacteria bacterium]|jgi:dipeptidyl aminopeptidase/acylaminoacyl peptidase|nr:prolyl oligopeptidase family serine peptidase [Ignavibacteria bacterium]
MNKIISTFLLIAIFLLLPTSVSAKRVFSFSDAMKFEMLRAPKLSVDAKYFSFVSQEDRGDITAHIYSNTDTMKYYIPNGRGIFLSNNSKWAAMTIEPSKMESENAKITKDKLNNSLKLINLQTGEQFDVPKLQRFIFSEDSRFLAYKLKVDDKPKMEKYKEKSLGSPLKLRHLESETEITIDWVMDFQFDSLSRYFFYACSTPDGKRDGVYYRDLNKEFAPERKVVVGENTNYTNIAFNEVSQQLAYLSAELTDKGKAKDCSLFIWNAGDNSIDTVALATVPFVKKDIETAKPDKKNAKNVKKDTVTLLYQLPTGWYIPNNNGLRWADTKQQLFFGLKSESERYNDDNEAGKFKDTTFYNLDTLLSKAEVYIWGYQDPLIMTVQQQQWNRTKDQYYATIYDITTKKYVQLADTNLTDVYIPTNNDFALGLTEKPYLLEQLYYGDYLDAYVVNIQTGEKTKIAERLEEYPRMSISGKYVVYFKDKHWYLYNTATKETANVTERIPTAFNDLTQDVPGNPQSNDFAGWLDDDKGFFIYDNWDVWYVDASNPASYRNVTQNGKTKNIKYTLRKVDGDAKYFKSEDTLIAVAYSKDRKEFGLYNILLTANSLAERIPIGQHFFRDVRKAKNTNDIYFAKESYTEFPNYYLTNYAFNAPKQISDMNLHILDTFNWGYTKLVNWKYKDTTLSGYLCLPDNYDSTKAYPFMCYFYDQMSDRTNRFYMPELTHRPVPQIYMDNYIIFFADIKYGVGSPGDDALESIVSGCRALAKEGILDTTRSCIQGHSWGAYQAAYIATKPTFFSAACAGAPVGNMTSAYSGIRLESGRARQFQYEAQQSRIGGNLFDSMDAYIRNSPVFYANRANTPLLISHGTIDEAVPYQQGVELFLAFKRANHPAYLLEYVDEPHWVGRYWNKLDYSVKMKEFFDHYCLGKPAPEWMTKGQPYKGENYGK